MSKFQYMLAPIEDFTDNTFRAFSHELGADLTFTEMARVESLIQDNYSTVKKIKHGDGTPTILQLIGVKDESYRTFLNSFEPRKGFHGFNINMGCPSPQMIKLGMGCAMMKRIQKAQNMIKLIRDYNYPVSIKMRLGMNGYEKERKVYLNLLDGTDADFYVVHARHGKETYDDSADFKVFEEIAKVKKNVVANGDIRTKEQVDYIRSLELQGVMIGREAIRDPGVFSRLKGEKDYSFEELRQKYDQFTKKFNTHEKFSKNVFKFMAQSDIMKGKMLK